MVITGNAERAFTMKTAIEDALRRAAAKPGAPRISIGVWDQGEAETELHVVVAGEPRVLEVSRVFLEDEPDGDMLRKVAAAASHLVAGDAPRVQLFHRGVYAAWSLGRESG